MECLQFMIPPLPQFMTVGHSFWKPGTSHFERNFNVYDMLFVMKGMLFMNEDGKNYEVGAGQMLALEAGKTHYGYRACNELTEIYWVHFVHPYPCSRILTKEIQWGSFLRRGTDQDTQPGEQLMYLPKSTKLTRAEITAIVPLLQEMMNLHMNFSLNNALGIHSLLAQLMNQLQASLQLRQNTSRSYLISKKLEAYLKDNLLNPFSSKEMENQLQLNFDYMSRCFKKHTGMTLLNYLRYLRIEDAKQYLLESDHSIPDIAELVGFTEYNYFIRMFRQSVGMPPGAYRREKQGFV